MGVAGGTVRCRQRAVLDNSVDCGQVTRKKTLQRCNDVVVVHTRGQHWGLKKKEKEGKAALQHGNDLLGCDCNGDGENPCSPSLVHQVRVSRSKFQRSVG